MKQYGTILVIVCATILCVSLTHSETNEVGSTGSKAIGTISEKMTEAEVRQLLGPPAEIRTIDEEHLLDGMRVYNGETVLIEAILISRTERVNMLNYPRADNGETHRWAYGVRQPGTFARWGIVSFDKDGLVIYARSPLGHPLSGPTIGGSWRKHEIRVPLSASSQSFDGLSCVVSNVTMAEARGETVRKFNAKLTVRNNDAADYKENVCSASLYLLSTVEIYDADKVLVFQDDRRSRLSTSGTPYILEINAGQGKTEQVDFIPGEYFGPLPPGQYFLRICLPLRKTGFIASNLLPFTVPEFPRESEYWDRFRSKASSVRGDPRR